MKMMMVTTHSFERLKRLCGVDVIAFLFSGDTKEGRAGGQRMRKRGINVGRHCGAWGY